MVSLQQSHLEISKPHVEISKPGEICWLITPSNICSVNFMVYFIFFTGSNPALDIQDRVHLGCFMFLYNYQSSSLKKLICIFSLPAGSKDHIRVQGEILEGLVARIVSRKSSEHMEQVLRDYPPPPEEGGNDFIQAKYSFDTRTSVGITSILEVLPGFVAVFFIISGANRKTL